MRVGTAEAELNERDWRADPADGLRPLKEYGMHSKMKNKHIGIIQARMGSTRLPQKSMADIAGKPLIWHIIYRLKKSVKLSKIYLATSISPENDILEKYVKKFGVKVFRGSEENVFSRFEKIVKVENPSTIVRICGDCPLIDVTFIDRVLHIIEEEKVDYVVGQEGKKSIHQGLDIVSSHLFKQLLKHKENPMLKEHVLNFRNLQLDSLKKGIIQLKEYEQETIGRLSIDTQSDLNFLRKLYEVSQVEAGKMSSLQIFKEFRRNPSLLKINSHVYQKSVRKNIDNFFYLQEDLGPSMLELARQYVEEKGLGVRFAVKREYLRNSRFENDGFGVVTYRNFNELKKIIDNNSKGFIISGKLPERIRSDLKLKIKSYPQNALVEYSHVNTSITK